MDNQKQQMRDFLLSTNYLKKSDKLLINAVKYENKDDAWKGWWLKTFVECTFKSSWEIPLKIQSTYTLQAGSDSHPQTASLGTEFH